MQNLIKTTNYLFKTEKEGFSARVMVVKDSDGNIQKVSLSEINQDESNYIGDLNLSSEALSQMTGITNLLNQVLNEIEEV